MIFWKNWWAKSEIEKSIQEHLPMLERIVASYESRPALQQELLQEVTLAIWQASKNFEGQSSLKTYMARIAQNRCVTHVDKAIKNPDGENIDNNDFSTTNSLSDEIEKKQQWKRLMVAVRELPLAQKQTVSLYFEGFSYQEISDITGLSVSNVGVSINRAKKALQTIIQTDED